MRLWVDPAFKSFFFGVSDSPTVPTDVQKINPCPLHMSMVYII